MIRVVYDTNILVSALITKKSSPPLLLYQAFINQNILLITSPSILIELEDVINRKNISDLHHLNPKQRREIVKQVSNLSFVTVETLFTKTPIITVDPKDDKFLYAAISGNAEYIVSGDHHLLDLHKYQEITILSPTEFLKILTATTQ